MNEKLKAEKGAGVLLHISSLPSRYGIGTFGDEAYKFVDFLKSAGQKYWQILPLNPTSYGDSPYQSPSAYAGNPYFIDLEYLIRDGLLTRDECDAADLGEGNARVDFEKQFYNRYPLLKKAFSRFDTSETAFINFCNENAFWLNTYAVFMAIKEKNNFQGLETWSKEEKLRKTVPQAEKEYKNNIEFNKFLQYKFFSQYEALHKYANDNGIQIIGDIPIYVAHDSADVWSDSRLFELDENLMPLSVAGVPPDYFSQDGQLWGNPLYNWDEIQKDDFAWWIQRIRFCLKIYDIVRIDHFRGFAGYYAIPYGDKNAKRGKWRAGKGIELFTQIKKEIPDANIIAEDLGLLDDDVLKLLKFTGYPGMKVLHFAFDSDDENPKNYKENTIVYTGTHDNNTSLGWYEKLGGSAKKSFQDVTGMTNEKKAVEEIIKLAYGTEAKMIVIPMQDFLKQSNDYRMNLPSTLGGINWQYRLSENYCDKKLVNRMKKLVKDSGR